MNKLTEGQQRALFWASEGLTGHHTADLRLHAMGLVEALVRGKPCVLTEEGRKVLAHYKEVWAAAKAAREAAKP